MAQRAPDAPFGAPDPKTVAFREALERALLNAPPVDSVDIEAMRRLRAAGEGILPIAGPIPEGAWRPYAGAEGGPNRMRVVDPGDARAVYFNIHGGGWTFGAPELGDGRALRTARETRAIVISPQYRLAPENAWPACIEDCMAALEAAIEIADGMGGAPLAVGGDSAGAHLAACALVRLRDAGRIDRVSAAVLTYGCYDLRLSPSVRNWGARNLILSTPIVDWFVGNLLPDRALAEQAAVSPLLADLSGMPPAFFQVGDLDPLIDDSMFMCERWRAAGAAAELVVWPGAFHGIDYFDDPSFELPVAAAFHAAAARFLNSRFDAV